MRSSSLLSLACAVWLGLVTAVAADQRDPRLDGLFRELRSVTNPVTARAVQSEIWSIWMEVDDREVRLDMLRGVRAMRLGRLDEAEGAFDAAIRRRPDFAEAWNQRATARYLAGRLAGSIADIGAALSLEPRHFGALSGLGMSYDRLDDPAAALRSYEAALAINPHLAGARERVEALRAQLAGAPI
ncbi:MAG: tetratricopeptide repeat protein [Geminicoccaceae bacterium]|nr:MAG: tetratricopeptide repeat protein [Geminicoccaceae bacterium]